jgi:hypothetical protein
MIFAKIMQGYQGFRRQHKQFLLVEVITKEAERVK